jgi:DNA-binding response OmpR family regulator
MENTKILVVDDDRILRALLQFKLSAQGSTVWVAETGFDALEMIAAHRPDLVVLDCMMPGMDGDETLRRLKADASTRSIPVVMLTARRGDDDAFRLLTLGASDHVAKPFNPDELVLRIRRFLESGEFRTASAPVSKVS